MNTTTFPYDNPFNIILSFSSTFTLRSPATTVLILCHIVTVMPHYLVLWPPCLWSPILYTATSLCNRATVLSNFNVTMHLAFLTSVVSYEHLPGTPTNLSYNTNTYQSITICHRAIKPPPCLHRKSVSLASTELPLI